MSQCHRLWRSFLIATFALSLAGAALAQDETEIPEVEATATEAATDEPTQQVAPDGNFDAKPIDIGAPVTDTLTITSPVVVYSFEGSAGDIIAITMTSDVVDSFLRMADSQGNLLMFDDDGGSRLNARIGPIMLPADATYLVVATTFDAVMSEGAEAELGAFTVTIDSYEAEPIRVPAQAQGELSEDAPLLVYSFEATMGDTLLVSLDSEDFDTFLTVEQTSNLNGLTLSDDDSGSDTNSLIVPYIVPETGTYFAIVSNYGDESVGDFVLNISPLTAADIAYGDSEETALSRFSPVLIYSFSGTEGDVIEVTVEAPDELDTTLTLLGPDGAQIAYNDDLVGRNPGIQGLQLPQNGTYKVVVQPFVPGTTGDLTLTLAESGGS
jgi:hypothetical protein